MPQAHLPDLNEILALKSEEGGFLMAELFEYLRVIISWMNMQYTHLELHEITHSTVDWVIQNWDLFAPEYQADKWRPEADAGNLDAIPAAFRDRVSADYLKYIADNATAVVPDFVPEDF
jgi:hypothetical protein